MNTNPIPEEVVIRYTTPGGAHTDITKSVIFADAYFEMQAAAVPGSFHITVKDPDHTHSFVAGGVIELWIGGKKMFGGFILSPAKDFFVPADRTDRPVMTRRWTLDGVDFNHLLDKRVLRNLSSLTKNVPDVTHASGHANDRYIIGRFADYFDLDFSGGNVLDVSTKVRHINDFSVTWKWPTPGSTMRQTLDALVIETTIHGMESSIYWVNASGQIEWLSLHDTIADWGFSDVPSGPGYDEDGVYLGTSFIGWRDGSAALDGSNVINEVFVWGGSPLGTNGAVVVGHNKNAGSIEDHGLWQMADVHPGETDYKTQDSVDARANALISGRTSGTGSRGTQGLVNPDTQYSLTWYAHDVPISGGLRQHLVCGDVTTLNLWSFSTDNGAHPYAIRVPMRQARVTFPTLPSDNPNADPLAFVQFQGTFGLFLSDPVWWWEFLRKIRPAPQVAPVIMTSNDSTTFPYGSYFTGWPLETPNGSRTLFTLPASYMAGSLEVILNGIPQSSSSFTETSPTDGTFTFDTAPVATDFIGCKCRTV